MTYDIFISYRRADRELVASVARRLEEHGVRVWYDAAIEGGAEDAALEALTRSGMMAIVFSAESNGSRQLGRELALADRLGKPVAPILVEATEPRGGNLYMLADRNWIRLAPEPLDQIDLLTEHLATLAGKDGTPSVAGETRTIFVPAAANDGIPAPPANDDEAGPQQPLDQALGEFLHGTDRPAKAAPKVAGAYVGSANRPGTPRGGTAGGLPLRRGDFIALGFVLTAVAAVALNQGPFASGAEAGFVAAAWMMLAAIACAALVLPVRSFLDWRSPIEALASHAISVAALYTGLAVIGVTGAQLGYFTWEGLRYDLSLAATVLAAYTVAAFALYGVLARRRAIRSFRSNIRTL